jgi:hypothetical protein
VAAVVLPAAGGMTDQAYSFLQSGMPAYEYHVAIIGLLCNLPFVYFFILARRRSYLYQLREGCMWEQYGALLTSVEQTVAQKDAITARVKNTVAEMALDTPTPKQEAVSASFFDIFRDSRDGLIAAIVMQKYFHALPRWHTNKMVALLVSLKASGDPYVQESIVATKFDQRLMAAVTEAHVSFTLEQVLRDQLGW